MPRPAGEKRHTTCLWCGGREGPLLGCSACPRVYCLACFKERPGYGRKAWNKALKDEGGWPGAGLRALLFVSPLPALPLCFAAL